MRQRNNVYPKGTGSRERIQTFWQKLIVLGENKKPLLVFVFVGCFSDELLWKHTVLEK